MEVVLLEVVEMYVILLDLTMSSAIYHFDKCCNIWLINSITRTSSSLFPLGLSCHFFLRSFLKKAVAERTRLPTNLVFS